MDLWNGGYWHQECPAFFDLCILIGAGKSMRNSVTTAALTLLGAEMDFRWADSPAGGKQCSGGRGRRTDARLGWIKLEILSWRFVHPRLELGKEKTGPGAEVQEKAFSQLGLRTQPKASTQGEWCDAWVAQAEDLGLEVEAGLWEGKPWFCGG